MIRISITKQAYDAIARDLPKTSSLHAPQLSSVLVWLPDALVHQLSVEGRKHKEDYSQTILRIAKALSPAAERGR